MMYLLICLLVVGAEVLATTPRRPPPGCPFPSGPYVPPKCGPNAYFEVCSYPCPPQNCSTLWTKYRCKEECCKPECRCKDGFLRDDISGLCIRRDECFAPCGPFERFVRSSTKCQKTCANYKVTGPQSMCKPFTGCVCKEGRVRLYDDATGPCVLPSQCPRRRCPIHEHLEECPSICLKETCISKSPDYKCLLPAIPLPCKPRCVCDKGYLRNHFGQCIPKNRCPIKRCPPNEVWRCASPCAQDSCKRLEPGFRCPPGVNSMCLPACTCRDGYLRNDMGFCIPRELCPASLRCGINEVAVECATVWPPQTCESVYTVYKAVDNVPCNPGCDCRPGYLRNRRNVCVPSDFCPTVPHKKCGPNQEYLKCGSTCQPSCASLIVSPASCSDECVEGCFCVQGYYKDEQGNCVPRDQCPLPVCPQRNEVWKDCGSACEMKTCENYKRTDIGCAQVCVRGCFCRDGYVRNAYHVCVLPEQCPPEPICLQENEEYQSCGSSCPDDCDNYKDTDRICTMQCVAGCNCKKGYVRNLQDKTCVKPEQCPTKDCTGVNEELNSCASYCPVTCANRFTLGDWACITLCREACDCIPGTLRNDNGTCVPVEQCTPPVCRENEKYMKCGTACSLTCDNYKNPPPCTKQCVEDCFCQDGYVRDRNMRCVKPENCEPICPLGEKFNECSAHCQDTCENYNDPNRICTYQCQSGCVCDTGTVRRKDGLCVPPSECTGTSCSADEVFDPCSAHCEPTCEHHEPDRPCTAICKPGCRCRDGLVRQNDGKCVKLEQCKPICPAGEKFDECSAHCQDTCENYNITNRPCTRQCQSGCVCGAGTVRRKDGQCVPPCECSPNQGCSDPNAERVVCGLASWCRPTCAVPNPKPCISQICVRDDCVCKQGYVLSEEGRCIEPMKCRIQESCNGDPNAQIAECPLSCPATCAMPNARPCPKPCEPVGCQCKPGYILSENNGLCILPENCKGGYPCVANETFVHCKVPCPSDRCPVISSPNTVVCETPMPCYPGCECKFNYLLRSIDDQRCIHAPECPPLLCPKNEIWSGCPSACLHEDCWDASDPAATCNLVLNCRPRCICKQGYLRDYTPERNCVPADQCPPRTCGLDEHYEKNTHKCQLSCSDYHLEPIMGPCAASSGCFCDRDLVKNSDGVCVSRKECPTCGPNAHYETNRNRCELTCQNYKLEPVMGACVPASGCFCDYGYVRDDNWICVRKTECPTCGLNEHYERDRIKCDLTCKNYKLEPIMGPCFPATGCFCDDGYVRDKNSICVKKDQCPEPIICPPNEVLSDCYNTCYMTCKTRLRSDGRVCHLGCTESGCLCVDGYLRHDNGTCVPISQCSPPSCWANETYSSCGPACPPTCRSRGDTCQVCTAQCVEDCFCDCGLVRADDGTCIAPKHCPPRTCSDPNEVFDECPPTCPPTDSCSNKWLEFDFSKYPKCCKPGCRCRAGYARNKSGVCITTEQCIHGE